MGARSGAGRSVSRRPTTAHCWSPTTAAMSSGGSPMHRTSLVALASIVLTAAAAGGAPASAQDAAKGAEVYQDRCGSCHVLNGVGQGPNLLGVVGRKAASVAGFNYSDAMKASGLTWTPSNL